MLDRAKRLTEVYEHLHNHCGVHTKGDFADMVKYNRAYISSALNGNEKYLTDKLFSTICDCFPGMFNLKYLLNGEGKLLADHEEPANENWPNVFSQVQTIDPSSLVNAALAAKDQTIAQLELRVSEKDKYIAMLEKRIADYEAAAEFIKENDFLDKYPFTQGVAEPCDFKRKKL
jgi:hypothetical protein